MGSETEALPVAWGWTDIVATASADVTCPRSGAKAVPVAGGLIVVVEAFTDDTLLCSDAEEIPVAVR